MLLRLLVLLILFASPAFASSWTDFATIDPSTRTPLTICDLDSSGNDFICPSVNPVIDSSGHVGVGTSTPNHWLDVNGNIGLGTSGYINFGTVDGSSGYGIRDNSGLIECKNYSGNWGACGDGAASTNFVPGLVGSPGLYVTGDANTGFYQAFTDTLSVTAGGKEIMRFDNNATASMVNYFDVAGSITGQPVILSAAGSNTDIGINIAPKGAGSVTIAGNSSGGIALAVTNSNTGANSTAIKGWAIGTTGATVGGLFQSDSSTGTGLKVVAGNAATKGLIVKGAASQTGNFAEFQNSSGTVLIRITSQGIIQAALSGAVFGLGITNTGDGASLTDGVTAQIRNAGSNSAAVRGANFGDGSFGGYFTSIGGTTDTIAVSGIGGEPAGDGSEETNPTITYGTGGFFKTWSNAGTALIAQAGDPGAKVFVAIGSSSQAGDLAQFQNDVGTVLAKVDANGYIAEKASGYINFGLTTGSSGYGIRDNGGTIECKNSSGSWGSCGAGAASTNFAAGNVSSPGLYVTGDTNTGFYQAVADTVSITAGGSEILRADNNGIGTAGVDYFSFKASAAGAPGVITESAAGSDADINMALLPKGAGGVGIGTNAPLAKADVNGSLKVADGGETCDAAHVGLFRYNAGTNKFQVCKSVP